MALKDLFKRKKSEPVKEKKEIKEEKKAVEKKPESVKKEPAKVSKPKAGSKDFAYRILQSPHITEKATDLAAENKYVFRVYERSNKTEIKKAVEGLYGVEVSAVKIIKVPPKKRIFKGIKGERKGYKKAIVQVKKGQKIDIGPR